MNKAQYYIGVDLGTTNSTLAYAKVEQDGCQIEQFPIPQKLANGFDGEELFLPSFLYFGLDQELAGSSKFVVGSFAKARGAEIPGRVIASAKSWLCQSGGERRQTCLPSSEDVAPKLAPYEACAEYLAYLKKAWDAKMPEAAFTDQQIAITVPASFDPGARQLVLEAAQLAGYPEVILLEEPLAAFYAWLNHHQEQWRTLLSVGDHILVIDIGGGTTDFTLIAVESENGDLSLKRLAVGSHLLLGGDNIDYSLAYLAKQKLEEAGHGIDDWQFEQLVHQCRNAKETLFAHEGNAKVDITIVGRGSKLIGNSLKTQITQKEAAKLILDGFFPKIPSSERSSFEKRSGMQQVGLQYAQDPRVTAQLAKFLSMTGEAEESQAAFVVPKVILFNGGTLKAAAFRERLEEVINAWAKEHKKTQVTILPEADYDFAVSQGAAFYLNARSGKSIRVKSGTNRSYYIGVEEAVPAVPGFAAPVRAVCIVPFGMEEGSEAELDNQEFALVVGEPAQFRFFSHATPQLSDGSEAGIGMIIKNWKKELTELNPIETSLQSSEDDGKTVRVKLRSCLNELGVLELWCQASDGRKWKLEFDVRNTEKNLNQLI